MWVTLTHWHRLQWWPSSPGGGFEIAVFSRRFEPHPLRCSAFIPLGDCRINYSFNGIKTFQIFPSVFPASLPRSFISVHQLEFIKTPARNGTKLNPVSDILDLWVFVSRQPSVTLGVCVCSSVHQCDSVPRGGNTFFTITNCVHLFIRLNGKWYRE